MTRFEISEGDVWAGNMWKRHANGVSGLTCGSRWSWDLSLDMSECPDGTTIKLCGVATVPFFRYNRVRRAGIGQLLSFTHEDSDRIIATKKRGSVLLRAYSYRQGHGPATYGMPSETPLDSFTERIGKVAHGERFSVDIYYAASVVGVEDSQGTVFCVRDAEGLPLSNSLVLRRRDRPTPALKHKTFAHARGYKQSHAPADIHINVF